MKISWDEVGKRFYETGVDHGVLYLPNQQGAYVNGVAWSGLTSISETPSGGEPNKQYADNIVYLNLFSTEEFGATLEAFTFPDEFQEFDGLGVPSPGVTVGQQARRSFGLSYRTRIGNDTQGDDYGYKLHLVYGCQASPSERSYSTVNDSPEAATLSWTLTTTPVPVAGMKPTSIITIDSTKVDPASLAALELVLYGDVGVDPALPSPDAVLAFFSGDVTSVVPSQPAFNAGTNTITIPTVTGIDYRIDGSVVPAGDLVITEDTIVVATAKDSYFLAPGVDNDWFYNHTP